MDTRAREVQAKPAPPNAGTKHLGRVKAERWCRAAQLWSFKAVPKGGPAQPRNLSRFGSSRVDGVLGEFGEQLVRVLLLNERLLEQTLGFREPQLLGPGEQGAVAGDLV